MASLPEIHPLTTDDVVLYELQPGGKWTAVRSAGERITVGLRTLSVTRVREVHACEGDEQRFDQILVAAVASVQHGSRVLTLDSVPYLHHASLAGVAFQRSVTGADPFFVAPAESQP